MPAEGLALRPLGVGEVLDASIRVYRSRFSALVRAVVLVIIPVEIVSALVSVSMRASQNVVTVNSQTGLTQIHRSALSVTLGGLALVQIVSLVGTALAQAAALKIVTDAYLGTRTTWQESLRFGFTRMWSVLWVLVIAILGTIVGLALCIIPGVWWYVGWSVAIPVLLLESTRGTKALGRSWRLVKGRWWATCGELLVARILAGIVTGVASAIVIPLALSNPNGLVAVVVAAVVGAVAATVTQPFIAAVVAVIYFDLRVRKEGFDLALMASRLGIAPPAPGAVPAMPWSPGVGPPPGWYPPPTGTPPGWYPPPNQPPGTPPGGYPPPNQPPGWYPPPTGTPPGWYPPPGQPPGTPPGSYPPPGEPPEEHRGENA